MIYYPNHDCFTHYNQIHRKEYYFCFALAKIVEWTLMTFQNDFIHNTSMYMMLLNKFYRQNIRVLNL